MSLDHLQRAWWRCLKRGALGPPCISYSHGYLDPNKMDGPNGMFTFGIVHLIQNPFWITALLHYPVVLSFRSHSNGQIFYHQDFLALSRIHGSINYGQVDEAFQSEAASQTQTNTNPLFDCYNDVLAVECFLAYVPVAIGSMSSRELYYWFLNERMMNHLSPTNKKKIKEIKVESVPFS